MTLPITRRSGNASHFTGRGMNGSEAVRPEVAARARRVEDRLIKLIDAGENLRDHYPTTRPNIKRLSALVPLADVGPCGAFRSGLPEAA